MNLYAIHFLHFLCGIFFLFSTSFMEMEFFQKKKKIKNFISIFRSYGIEYPFKGFSIFSMKDFLTRRNRNN